ncbi:MAG TPA: putative oxidoreductase C-terminal domain-containing protein [Bacteroidales bacterium]|nr:oxidoreductase [Bacteroidales bacterium]HNR42142.1 putative oxidoreductase C-terminal domain-containing protein [Bacteroidales bacterium]HPM18936.1 putative oxidoreductase C-terminal domain-containing protein [Bacteroidales bacterium]
MRKPLSIILSFMLVVSSCGPGGASRQKSKGPKASSEDKYPVQLITVDPGHFHAALVQKSMFPQVSPDVHVYAPDGPDLQQHLDRIASYNKRPVDPTSWNEIVYRGNDFFEKMLSEKPGNVVVLSGNNKKKAEYISRSIDAGLNVLADKPMIIYPEDFPILEKAFQTAEEKGVLLYDIMTERFEITTILQKILSQNENVFGKLTTGSRKDPAVSKISVHHFSKLVSGAPLIRPAWYFDVEQQGEGIVDVTTHLVDLIQWACFPDQILNPADINMVSARRWPTVITRDQFRGVTGYDDFPEFLLKDVRDGNLNVFANGEMVYQIKGVWAKVSVEWHYQAPPGGGDTHYSVMKGTGCDLVIRQGREEKFIPTLYAENIRGRDIESFTTDLREVLAALPYDSLGVEPFGKSALRINIPDKYRVSHEEHFGQVASKFLLYLNEGSLPYWEVPGMITKYYTTTSALKMALEKQ